MAPGRTSSSFAHVKKRDGRAATFDPERIERAVRKAMSACAEGDLSTDPQRVTAAVLTELQRRFSDSHVPAVEEIQDVVEETLILLDFARTAKAYILYRHGRAQVREKRRLVPEAVRERAARSKQYFRSSLAEFVYYRTYSRWIEEEGRRETWLDTVDRYLDFMHERLGDRLTQEEYARVRLAILHQRVMPSMRLLWAAGRAARQNNITAYNCSYICPTRLDDLAEIMYLLMCGVGVGFSVESQASQQLPIIKWQHGQALPRHTVGDSKEGWADALKLGLCTWFEGEDIQFDYRRVRPAGSRLATMGGRASGPGPLQALLDFARSKILAAQGRRLRNIDLHDIICTIGEVVVMGGVRRSALISLSDLDDEELRQAKTGHFFISHPERAMANNSAVYLQKPDAVQFICEWLAIAQGGTGERGLFNRGGIPEQMPARRRPGFESHLATCGINPCGEIILRSKQLCNLSEVIARPEDDLPDLLDKITVAALLGTYQSTLTDFPYVCADWQANCEQERLLGVSVTGQWDCPAVRDPQALAQLRQQAIEVNQSFASRLGIQPSASITCVKPSGTVSQLVDAASGMHPRFAKYYVRRIRISASDPLFAMLKDQKFPHAPEVGQDYATAATFVLEFPVKAPEHCVTRSDLGALEQLRNWQRVKEHYTEHNPSVTILVAADEWIAVADWLFRHWNLLGGLSFLPRSDSVYALAPYEEITAEQYHERLARMPQVDFANIVAYEKHDSTATAQELACTGGSCEFDPEEGSLPGRR